MFDIVSVFPLAFRIFRERRLNNSGRPRLVYAARPDLRRFPQRADAVGRERPAGEMGSDAPAGAQHVVGDCQFVGGCANISDIVVEDEVFEVDEFAVDPEGRTGIGEVGALNPALTDRRTGDALVQTSQSDCGFYFEVSNWKSSLGC